MNRFYNWRKKVAVEKHINDFKRFSCGIFYFGACIVHDALLIECCYSMNSNGNALLPTRLHKTLVCAELPVGRISYRVHIFQIYLPNAQICVYAHNSEYTQLQTTTTTNYMKQIDMCLKVFDENPNAMIVLHSFNVHIHLRICIFV